MNLPIHKIETVHGCLHGPGTAIRSDPTNCRPTQANPMLCCHVGTRVGSSGLKIGSNTRAVSKAPAWLARDRQCYDCNQALPLQGAGVALSKGRARVEQGSS